jgi:pimeloyl-ACP methyl ester carboxylesterase/predicted glycosyltransferase
VARSLDRGNGVSIAWDSQGSGTPAVLLLPTWSIATSRIWKLQVPYLARHHRVLTYDPRGNGASSRPPRAEDYADDEFVADAVAVLDAAGVEQAVVVGFSCGGRWGIELAGRHPERVLGLVAIAPALPTAPRPQIRTSFPFDTVPDTDDGWAKYTRHYWRKDYRGFLEFFFGEMACEPHSTRVIEDCVGWGLDIGEPTLELTEDAPQIASRAEAIAACEAVQCPVLVLSGDNDRITGLARAEAAARHTGGELVTLAGADHGVPARRPVAVGTAIHEFAARLAGRAQPAAPARAATPRALMVSSPIGLGHARRDLAIARELRARVPGLEIDWLAQEPTRRALEAAGERVHPMSDQLLSESGHIEAWAGEHELWVFEAIRRMEEVLAANYFVFRDLVTTEHYDLWIADEAWELDHFLHENPGDKRAPFVWLTDFVGWIPLPEHGEREAWLAADLNAEMVEHVDRHPEIRDLSLFVGDPEDVVPGELGPGLPSIREWTERHFTFTGQIVDPMPANGRNGGPPVCVVSPGGSGVCGDLLKRAAAALPELRRRVPDARMQLVTGPRVDPAAFAPADGLSVIGYDPDLTARLAACDAALVHGGLSTGMELVAAGRPFVSVPLSRHFEQQRHVRHRLVRHGHTRTVAAAEATPERLAEELAAAMTAAPDYAPVPEGGAAFAAERIAALL